MTGATATQSFGATSFDVVNTGPTGTPTPYLIGSGPATIYQGANGTPGNGLTTGARKLWTPNNPVMTDVGDSSGNPIPNIYTGGVASDAGTAADYLALTNAIDPSNLNQTFSVASGGSTKVADPRMTMGVGSPFLLGSMWVVPGATAPTTLNIANASYLIADSSAHQLLTPAVNITGIATHDPTN